MLAMPHRAQHAGPLPNHIEYSDACKGYLAPFFGACMPTDRRQVFVECDAVEIARKSCQAEAWRYITVAEVAHLART
jgi:hypothetical protein